jgi:hypothetical protein
MGGGIGNNLLECQQCMEHRGKTNAFTCLQAEWGASHPSDLPYGHDDYRRHEAGLQPWNKEQWKRQGHDATIVANDRHRQKVREKELATKAREANDVVQQRPQAGAHAPAYPHNVDPDRPYTIEP